MTYTGLITWGPYTFKIGINVTSYDKESHLWGEGSTYSIQLIPNEDTVGAVDVTQNLNPLD